MKFRHWYYEQDDPNGWQVGPMLGWYDDREYD